MQIVAFLMQGLISVFRTLDHMEMFEQQKVFKIEDYIKMSEFLNLFVFRILWNGYMGKNDSKPQRNKTCPGVSD